MQDPAQREAALRQRFAEDAAPIAQSAQAAVPAMPVSEAISATPNTGTILPRAKEAGKVFEALEQQIGDHVVAASAPGDVALDAADWASRGGQMPKVMKDFIKRTTDPNQGDLTFSEARQFLSNAGQRLLTAEQM